MQSHHMFFSGLSCARHILCTSVNRDFHQCLFIKPSGLLNNNWKVSLSASRHCWWARIQGIASTLCPGSKWVLSSPIVQSESCPAAGARAVIQLLGSFSTAVKLTRLCLTSNVKISFCFCSSCFSPPQPQPQALPPLFTCFLQFLAPDRCCVRKPNVQPL